ncbi:OadG family protein [Halomonas sp. NO4]|uniref:OadG family protein n=1 Tax=Halomonas sp. NO4 TaxID=2484813 RepID=UPI0013D212EA|nr:OadG family protein [Halomonas sp. NO4]
MQDTQLLQDGLALMGVGMGFVFVFLTILVLLTTLMSLIVRRVGPKPAAVPSADRPAATPARSDDTELMAVISTAVHRYRRHRR